MIIVTIYRVPSKGNFLEVLNENMNKNDPINNKTYILGDLNINLFLTLILSQENMYWISNQIKWEYQIKKLL